MYSVMILKEPKKATIKNSRFNDKSAHEVTFIHEVVFLLSFKNFSDDEAESAKHAATEPALILFIEMNSSDSKCFLLD